MILQAQNMIYILIIVNYFLLYIYTNKMRLMGRMDDSCGYEEREGGQNSKFLIKLKY